MNDDDFDYRPRGEAWFDERGAAKLLDVGERTLRRWRGAGKVPFTRTPGGRIRYMLTQIVEIRASMLIGAASASGQT